MFFQEEQTLVTQLAQVISGRKKGLRFATVSLALNLLMFFVSYKAGPS